MSPEIKVNKRNKKYVAKIVNKTVAKEKKAKDKKTKNRKQRAHCRIDI